MHIHIKIQLLFVLLSVFLFGCAAQQLSPGGAAAFCANQRLPGGCLSTTGAKCFNYSCKYKKQGCENQLTCDEIKQEMDALMCNDLYPQCKFKAKSNDQGYLTPLNVKDVLGVTKALKK